MAEQRDVIDNPIAGQSITFRKRARDTGGELLQFELIMQPNKPPMAEHVHLRQEERLELVSGTVRFRLGGKERTLAAGETVSLPPGVPHTVWNEGGDDAHLLFEVRPALNAEAAFETLFGLARDGKTNGAGMPNPLQGAVLAREYETFLPWPPVPVQRLLLGAVAAIAKLFGYRPRYSKYSGPA